MSNFTKIRPVVAELFHADGQTDMTTLIVAFSNCAKAPKNGIGMGSSMSNKTKQILHGAFTQAIQFARADMSVIPLLGDDVSTNDVL